MKNRVNEIMKELENESKTARSAWRKGISIYAIELLENLEGRELTKENLLNGAQNFKQYSYSANSLIYDEDICNRLCNNTEKKRTKNGLLMPNKFENWLDMQARALEQAYDLIIKINKKIETNILKYLNDRMKEEYTKKENEHKHITYIRKKVLEEAKKDELIKDYRPIQNTKKSDLIFGSLAGFDKMYKIIL